jgi:hypothetical protein
VSRVRVAHRLTLLLFATTLFSSAVLLFCVEPMVARMLLPALGGAPAVWLTCMLFFQTALLAAYAYAHGTSAWLGTKRQALLHLALLAAPLWMLPIGFGSELERAAQVGGSPVARLLALLVIGAGLPFFVVSTSAPLLQTWFSRTGHPSARDPYFLYAASNLGSIVGLAAYPAIVERSLGLAAQTRLWKWGYVVLVLLVSACALVVTRTGESVRAESNARAQARAPVEWARRARWIALAFVPSSLLLGVTSYVTTDIAPLPLFWVIPLGLYLASFLCVFARKPPLPHAGMVRGLPLAVTTAAISMAVQARSPGWFLVVVHCATLFLASMVCHGELARDRPEPAHLTEYYLWISVGGVLGGVFNAVLAPALFDRIVEYPLAIVLACMFRRVGAAESTRRERLLDVALPALVLLLGVGLLLARSALALDSGSFATRLVVSAPLLVAHGLLRRPLRYALAVGAGLLASTLFPGEAGRTVVAWRNFYGLIRVTHDDRERFVQLVHGNTVHGRQYLDPALRKVPLAYYDRSGPLGAIFAAWGARVPAPARVAVIGLGSGGMAPYARHGDAWTFYEINPAVTRLARDSSYFTFLSDAFPGGENLSIREGDARLRLKEGEPHALDLLVLDAFSSDAIPAHLLTREALDLYLEKLGEHGLLAAHISNQFLDLRPVFGALARDAGLVALSWADVDLDPVTVQAGKVASLWVALARRREDLGALAHDAHWQELKADGIRGWTDDFSDLLGVYRW